MIPHRLGGTVRVPGFDPVEDRRMHSRISPISARYSREIRSLPTVSTMDSWNRTSGSHDLDRRGLPDRFDLGERPAGLVRHLPARGHSPDRLGLDVAGVLTEVQTRAGVAELPTARRIRLSCLVI